MNRMLLFEKVLALLGLWVMVYAIAWLIFSTVTFIAAWDHPILTAAAIYIAIIAFFVRALTH